VERGLCGVSILDEIDMADVSDDRKEWADFKVIAAGDTARLILSQFLGCCIFILNEQRY
jgi:hypothetical protein